MSGKDGQKNQDYVARGLKATIHNDNTSEEAKASAAERLEKMGVEVPADYANRSDNQEYTAKRAASEDYGNDEGDDQGLSLKGVKDKMSSMSGDNVSEEKKEHAGAVRSAQDWDSWARERVEQPRTMAVAGKSDVFG